MLGAAMALGNHKHIIWDWNGTLFDDAALCVSIMNGMLERRGLPALTLGRYRACFDFPVIDYYRRVGFDFARESWEAAAAEFMADYYARWRECVLHPGVEDALEAAAAAGAAQSVLSAAPHPWLEVAVDYFGLRRRFTDLLGKDDHFARGKHDTAGGWLRERAFEPGEVLMIGDTTHDWDVARSIGADCVLVRIGHHPPEKLASCGVPVFGGLTELAAALD